MSSTSASATEEGEGWEHPANTNKQMHTDRRETSDFITEGQKGRGKDKHIGNVHRGQQFKMSTSQLIFPPWRKFPTYIHREQMWGINFAENTD